MAAVRTAVQVEVALGEEHRRTQENGSIVLRIAVPAAGKDADDFAGTGWHMDDAELAMTARTGAAGHAAS